MSCPERFRCGENILVKDNLYSRLGKLEEPASQIALRYSEWIDVFVEAAVVSHKRERDQLEGGECVENCLRSEDSVCIEFNAFATNWNGKV